MSDCKCYACAKREAKRAAAQGQPSALEVMTADRDRLAERVGELEVSETTLLRSNVLHEQGYEDEHRRATRLQERVTHLEAALAEMREHPGGRHYTMVHDQYLSQLREHVASLESALASCQRVNRGLADAQAEMQERATNPPEPQPAKPDTMRIVLHLGGPDWHDGPGWYYTEDELECEGSVGAFADRAEAIRHAETSGLPVVVTHEPAKADRSPPPEPQPAAEEVPECVERWRALGRDVRQAVLALLLPVPALRLASHVEARIVAHECLEYLAALGKGGRGDE